MDKKETNGEILKEDSPKKEEEVKKSHKGYLPAEETTKLFQQKQQCSFWTAPILLCIGLIAGGFLGLQLNNNLQCPEGMVKGEAVEISGKTWVPYDEPLVNVIVLEDKNCQECNFDGIIKQIKQGLVPTLSIQKVDISSAKGQDLIKKFGIKSLPCFVFDKKIEKITNFDQVSKAFKKNDDLYLLNTGMVGIKAVKFLETPQVRADDAQKGPEDAPITIIEISDYQCPYSKKGNSTLRKVFEKYPGKIKLVFKNMPLGFHKNAQKAAEAAECAGDQGKFWEMHDMLFENQKNLEISELKNYAKNLGLDTVKFNQCLDSGKFKEKIDAQIKEVKDFGITGTPGFFINDRFLGGAYPLEEFTKLIDEMLGK